MNSPASAFKYDFALLDSLIQQRMVEDLRLARLLALTPKERKAARRTASNKSRIAAPKSDRAIRRELLASLAEVGLELTPEQQAKLAPKSKPKKQAK